MNKNENDLYMHPQSGDIQTYADWLEDSKEWEGDVASQLATLFSVEYKYRFDDSTGKVYKFSDGHRCYVYIGSYLAYGINPRMSDKAKERKVTSDRS